jgi:predicted amidohydrolase
MCGSADLVVLPENLTLELLNSDYTESSVPSAIADTEDLYVATFKTLAEEKSITIVGGSTMVRRGGGFKNACGVFAPGSPVEWQEKVKLTTYERDVWAIAPGAGLTRLPDPIGVLICYDSEFPEAARVQAEAGVKILCVPAYTETRQGFQRVRFCCQARAVENQIFVVHSSLAGSLNREPVLGTSGGSAILTPSIEPFPEAASLAATDSRRESVAIAEMDLGALESARMSGDVRNWHDRDSSVWTLN